MRILYLSEQDIDLSQRGIYSDLINTLAERGHSITLCCADSRYPKTEFAAGKIPKLKIKVPNQFGVNFIKKGLVLLRLEGMIRRAVAKHLKKEQFDLVLYATPPITLAGVIAYCKKTFHCRSYLMLKDIFPQNAVDLGILSEHGLRGILYRFFKAKEKKLYRYSDRIGCMSPANISYLIRHEPYLDRDKIELFPNAVRADECNIERDPSRKIFEKYGIDKEKLVFVYGGNFGKPQGLDFLAEAIAQCRDIQEVHFVMVGKGGEKEKFFRALRGLGNVTALDALPKDEYEQLCAQCDVGMVVLDKRFTIPNYPSRILSYLGNVMPVFACTDKSCDVKDLLEQAQCGKWCYSGSLEDFKACVRWFVENRAALRTMGENGKKYLAQHFDVKKNIEKLETFIQGK